MGLELPQAVLTDNYSGMSMIRLGLRCEALMDDDIARAKEGLSAINSGEHCGKNCRAKMPQPWQAKPK